MRIGFITCADLSRYFVSKKNPLFTHDDQVACDFLTERGILVHPVPWGTPVASIVDQFNLLIVRSPWDYMDSEQNRLDFFEWLGELEACRVPVANPYSVLKWNLDKHYLRELKHKGVQTVPSDFIEPDDPSEALLELFKKYSRIVVKPCISAAANDTYRILTEQELSDFVPVFQRIRRNRSFIVQPYIEEICNMGEWSLVFLNGTYSHAVLKLPKPGHWLVQDELGGSVQSLDPPEHIVEFGIASYQKLDTELLYARVDILGGDKCMLGELELVEPELFFLERRHNAPNLSALEQFHRGIRKLVHN